MVVVVTGLILLIVAIATFLVFWKVSTSENEERLFVGIACLCLGVVGVKMIEEGLKNLESPKQVQKEAEDGS